MCIIFGGHITTDFKVFIILQNKMTHPLIHGDFIGFQVGCCSRIYLMIFKHGDRHKNGHFDKETGEDHFE